MFRIRVTTPAVHRLCNGHINASLSVCGGLSCEGSPKRTKRVTAIQDRAPISSGPVRHGPPRRRVVDPRRRISYPVRVGTRSVRRAWSCVARPDREIHVLPGSPSITDLPRIAEALTATTQGAQKAPRRLPFRTLHRSSPGLNRHLSTSRPVNRPL